MSIFKENSIQEAKNHIKKIKPYSPELLGKFVDLIESIALEKGLELRVANGYEENGYEAINCLSVGAGVTMDEIAALEKCIGETNDYSLLSEIAETTVNYIINKKGTKSYIHSAYITNAHINPFDQSHVTLLVNMRFMEKVQEENK